MENKGRGGKVNFELPDSERKDFVLVSGGEPGTEDGKPRLRAAGKGVTRRFSAKKRTARKAFVNKSRARVLPPLTPRALSVAVSAPPSRVERDITRIAPPPRLRARTVRKRADLFKVFLALVLAAALFLSVAAVNILYNRWYDNGAEVAAKILDSAVTVRSKGVNLTDIKLGSGVVVGAGGGKTYIATNYHVIENSLTENGKIWINTFGGTEEYEAILFSAVSFDKEADVALLTVAKTPEELRVKIAKRAALNSLKYGETVYAAGNGLGLGISVKKGIVNQFLEIRPSEIADDKTSDENQGVSSPFRGRAVRIDAAIYPGDSGCGLFNRNGELTGLVFGKRQGAENIAFALTLERFTEFLRLYI